MNVIPKQAYLGSYTLHLIMPQEEHLQEKDQRFNVLFTFWWKCKFRFEVRCLFHTKTDTDSNFTKSGNCQIQRSYKL